jgi:YesN/AraC family two-component response regulator
MLEIDPKANLTVVGQANKGCEAVELFAQLQPDIGLIDLQMPQMDGVAVIAAIRQKFSTARLIVSITYIAIMNAQAVITALKRGIVTLL